MLARIAIFFTLILLAGDNVVAQGTRDEASTDSELSNVLPDATRSGNPKTSDKARTTLSNTKDIAATIQSICVALAALTGSAWALYTFRARRERDKAEADLLKVQADTQKAEAELAAIQKTLHSEARLTAEFELADQNQRAPLVISGSALVSNNGNRNIRLDLGEEVFRARRVESDDGTPIDDGSFYASGVREFQDTSGETIWNLPYVIVQAGTKRRCAFWLRVSEPGVYYVEFTAAYTGLEANQVPIEAGAEREHSFALGVGDFTVVAREAIA